MLLGKVTSSSLVAQLNQLGCRLFFYRVCARRPGAKGLADRKIVLKKRYPTIFSLSFPGDEAEMGGCLAAGWGFFHISPSGEAQACPFSPHSDRILRQLSMLDVLQSDFFKNLQQENLVGGEHTGGCTLDERRDAVAAILQRSSGSQDDAAMPQGTRLLGRSDKDR
jgi:MoaA/NifB/PqqE/SkfB family radical SAM enzyme